MLENGWYATIDRRIEEDEPQKLVQCEECGRWIYEGETALELPGGGWMCEGCMESHTVLDMTEDRI